MPQVTKHDQLRDLLRPLAEQFTAQVGASIMTFVRDSVREEVEAVLGRALAPLDGSGVPPGAAALPAPAGRRRPKVECTRQRCHGSWYRPSGSERKLCYKHYLEDGGKPPSGKRVKRK